MKKQFSLKKAYVLFAVALFGATSMNAATIKVSSDAVSAGVNYNTIQAAYDYVKGLGTISEPYTIEVQSTYAGETTYPISLTAIAGASVTNKITITPAAGVITSIAPIVSAPTTAVTAAAASDVANGITKFTGTIGSLASGYKIFGMGLSAGTTVTSITDGVVKLDKAITYAADNLRQNTTWIAVPADGTILMSASTLPYSTNVATLAAGLDMATLSVGMLVGGNGIAYGTTITAIDAATRKVTISNNIGMGKQNATLYFADAATGLQVTPTSFNIPLADASTAKVGMFVSGTGVGSGISILSVVGTDIFTNQVGGTFATGITLSLSSAPTFVIRLDGAQYVTIDGGSKANLTIDNANTAAGNTIQMINDASNNTIKNCTIKGASPTSTFGAGVILIGNLSGGVTGCDNNTIDNCDVNGVFTAGIGVNITAAALATANNNTTVSNCNIFDLNTVAASSVYGIIANGSTSLTTVKDNQIYWTVALTPTVANLYFGMHISGETNTITGNKVGYSTSVASTSITSTAGVRFVGILTAGGPSAAPTTVSGNTVANVALTTASGGDTNANNAGNGMMCGIASDNYYPASNTAARAYITVSNNTVKDLSLNCSVAPAGNVYWNLVGFNLNTNFVTATGNTAKMLSCVNVGSTFKQAARGINAANSTVIGATISGNTVHDITVGDITATNTGNQLTAISCSSTLVEGNGSVVEKNMVYNVKALNSGNTAVTFGLQTYNNNALAIKDIIVKNNVVRLGTDFSCNGSIYGYFPQDHGSSMAAANSKVYFYNNSIYIGGTAKDAAAATGNTACIFRPISKIGATMDFKNNILSNKRSGGITGKHTAIMIKAATDYNGATQFLTSNNNLFDLHADAIVGGIVAAASPSSAALVTTFATLDVWNNAIADATPGTTYDVDSKTGNPSFVNAAGGTNGDEVPDMHISNPKSPANQTWASLDAVTDDFSGAIRAEYTPNDLGAYVIEGITGVETANVSSLSIYAANSSIVFDNLVGRTANVYSLNGQLIQSVTINSDKQAVAALSGCYVVKVGDKVAKVLVK